MRRFDIWDALFWFFMLILVGYIIAKLFGLINTSDWINLLPLISVMFLLGISYQRIINFMDKMFVRTDYLKNNLDKINERLFEHDERFLRLETNIDMLVKTQKR